MVLQKDADSKNPDALEFPGGKIDDIKSTASTPEERQRTAVEEVRQETGIDVSRFPIETVENFTTFFEVIDKTGIKKKYKRLVHLFLIRLPDTEEFVPLINQTETPLGQSEDKHKNYKWLPPSELIDSVLELKENGETGERLRPLARNSRHIKKLLSIIE